MKKILILFLLFATVFAVSCVFARDNKVIKYTTDNLSNKVKVSAGDKYSNEQNKEKEVILSAEAKKEKKEEIQNSIKAKQKEIIEVQKSRGSNRSIENKVKQLKLEIKELQKELNSI